MKDLTGQIFGRLTVAWPVGRNKSGNIYWLSFCSCGKQVISQANGLCSGATKSCGCLQRELVAERTSKHGHSRVGRKTRECNTWTLMKARCSNPNVPNYKFYGGRGIAVCERWQGEHGFENFLSDMGPRPAGKSIDRYPNKNGNYEPNNCRWATQTEQCRNQRKRSLRKAA